MREAHEFKGATLLNKKSVRECFLEILGYCYDLAPLLGWNEEMLEKASRLAGLESIHIIMFSGGLEEFTLAFFDELDFDMVEAFYEGETEDHDSVNKKIRRCLKIRFGLLFKNKVVVKEVFKYFLTKGGATLATRLAYRTVDMIWKLVDSEGSYSDGFYTKRASLFMVYASLQLHFNQGKGYEEIMLLIDSKIDKVMKFYKAKSKITNNIVFSSIKDFFL